MSVIVMGMEMPENCHVCGLCFGGLCFAIPPEFDVMCPDEDRPDWCPLRPLPEKHGRLIDADAFIEMMKKERDESAMLDEVILKVCRGGIKSMPTIVEAEVD